MATLREWLSNPALGLVRSVRSSQIAMAEAVDDVIANGGLAFLEAGTGTGKSFAYGLPAVLSDKRVVISTGKKALQEQLVAKDLPHLTRTVRGAGYALVKGKGNYVCELRVEEFRNSSFFLSIPNAETERFLGWLANDQSKEGVGDLSGWNLPWIHNVRVTECVKKHCPHAEGCGYVRSRERAKAARLLVVNHALLAHDLALGGGKILGEYDVLVIDEAHQAPKFFRDAFSLHLHPRQPDVIARTLKDSDFELGEDFARVYVSIFSALPNRAQELHIDATLTALFGELYAKVSRVHEAMLSRGILDDAESGESGGPSESARIRAKLRAGGMMLGKVRRLCEIVLALPPGNAPTGDAEDATPVAPPSEWVKFVEKRNRDETQVVVTPLEVGPLVAPSLLSLGGVVVTSATLATANGMEYVAREYGLSTKQIRLKSVYPSPFDYANQSALYVSGTSPDPASRNADYYARMCVEVHELCDASRGGAFVLCASTEDMEEIHNGIYKLNVLTRGPTTYRLGKQTGASPEVLVKWFLDDPTSVLVGLKTYWEGVDIPGDALRLVVIPRLPFPNRGDVILTARKRAFIERLQEENPDLDTDKAGIRAWEAFDFQEAIMDLKQGAGRLIRTETDRGIVAILDKRAYRRAKNYSHKVRAALPHPETYEKETVLQILRGFGAQALARTR
jgi:ATP-dependent DNA helicase DinG